MNYYIFILGCQYNYYDATRIAHLLEKMGYVLSEEKQADLIIVLACSVRQKGVDRIFGKINNWQKLPQKPKIIITACMLESDKKKLIDKVEAIVDTKDIAKWLNCHIVYPEQSRRAKKSIIKSNNLTIQQCNNLAHLSEKGQSFRVQVFLPRGERKNTVYVPIMQGCDNFCTYCAVPYTRGREVSRPENEIIDEVKEQLKKGFKKIILLGQNVNSWGKKLKITRLDSQKARLENEKLKTTSKNLKLNVIPFGQLLEKIDQIPDDFSYNFMSSNPHDFTDDLVKTLSKLTKWEKVLHLPLQSGDDEILKKMNRKYNAAQYLSLISNLKSKIENLKLTTDIIVGFPGETVGQFQNTVKLCKKIGFFKAYVSQYSPRPQTFSAREMNDNVSKIENKRRWEILNDLINNKNKNRPT